MKVIVKSFMTHKRGECDTDIQDSVHYNVNLGRFALSDGVSGSFLPQLLAKQLTRDYVNSTSIVEFPDTTTLQMKFQQARNRYMASLTEEERTLQEMVEDEFKGGAATFIGVNIKNNLVSWQVIGDSCLFILPDEEPIQCVCSMPVATDASGRLIIKFNNKPAQIHSDGTILGEWIKGSKILNSGWILLMSDAMSAWFIKQYNEGIPVQEQLFDLVDHIAFENFVEREYQVGNLKSDDESVILVKFEEEEEEITLNEESVNNMPDATDDTCAEEEYKEEPNKDIIVTNSDIPKVPPSGEGNSCQKQGSHIKPIRCVFFKNIFHSFISYYSKKNGFSK